MKNTRPELHQIPLAEGWIRPGVATITVSKGQWDALHEAAYNAGLLILELDKNEMPLALYQKGGAPKP